MPARSPAEVRRATEKEKQAARQREEKMFEKERQRAEAGRKGAMRAFTASQSDPDLSEKLQWKPNRRKNTN